MFGNMYACDVAKLNGITPTQYRARIQQGWSVERAVTTPVRKSHKCDLLTVLRKNWQFEELEKRIKKELSGDCVYVNNMREKYECNKREAIDELIYDEELDGNFYEFFTDFMRKETLGFLRLIMDKIVDDMRGEYND